MSIEGFPLAPVSNTGVRYLGMDARPEFLTNLELDPTYQKAAAKTLSKTRTGEVVSIPINNKDLRDTMVGLNSRQVAPLEFAETRKPLTNPDITNAAINHHVFGMGLIDTFRSDKPQSGLNYLRKELKVPMDSSAGWNVPTVGPYNPFSFSSKESMGYDPRYSAPKM